MEPQNPFELVGRLRSPSLRVRTGLWLAPLDVFWHEKDEAARLGVDALDIRQLLLADLPDGTRFLGLTSDSIVDTLDNQCRNRSGNDCALVYNFDLPLARLRQQERLDLWKFFYALYANRSRAFLFLMPKRAEHLLPGAELLQAWRRDGRLVG